MPIAPPIPKSPIAPAPQPSAKELAERLVKLAADVDAQRGVVERARGDEKAATSLRMESEAALKEMQDEAGIAMVAWKRVVEGK